MMLAKPGKEHAWLQKLVGDWSSRVEFPPDQEVPGEHTGVETVRGIGDLWIVAEGRSQMPDGTPAKTMMTLGYDPRKERFVGTWLGSMMDQLWVYEGKLDESGKVLTLDTEGPDPTGKIVKIKEVIEIKDDNERIMTSRVPNDDGSWKLLMTATYKRQSEGRTMADQGVIPHLVIENAAEALEFYKKALGAEEVGRVPAQDGKSLLHAEMRVNGARVFMRDHFPEHQCGDGGKISAPKPLGGTSVTIHLSVPNCDAAVERAAAAGASVIMAPWDAFWGERYGQVLDPFGHSWSFSHPLPAKQG